MLHHVHGAPLPVAFLSLDVESVLAVLRPRVWKSRPVHTAAGQQILTAASVLRQDVCWRGRSGVLPAPLLSLECARRAAGRKGAYRHHSQREVNCRLRAVQWGGWTCSETIMHDTMIKKKF